MPHERHGKQQQQRVHNANNNYWPAILCNNLCLQIITWKLFDVNFLCTKKLQHNNNNIIQLKQYQGWNQESQRGKVQRRDKLHCQFRWGTSYFSTSLHQYLPEQCLNIVIIPNKQIGNQMSWLETNHCWTIVKLMFQLFYFQQTPLPAMKNVSKQQSQGTK